MKRQGAFLERLSGTSIAQVAMRKAKQAGLA